MKHDQLLIVEDDQFKEAALRRFFETEYPDFAVSSAWSFSSAIAKLRKESPSWICLDMSLPTYDISPQESGGRPNGFGGWDVMRFIDAKQRQCNVVVVTQFDSFELNGRVLTIETLMKIFSDQYTNYFVGIVKYDSTSDSWHDQLREIINGNK